MSALASLAKENHSVASKLARSSEGPSMFSDPLPVLRHLLKLDLFVGALSLALALCKSRLPDLQLAACLW